ncbi:MAG TPA: HupE/UreJ family protein [Burkholderiales bacterium]|nr:HupE/UreJ family protein [Burkholderiales bacterium]
MRVNLYWWVQALILACVATGSAHAHHVMDYAVPATALEGFLSGIGHPVIGVDHLIFVIGAGVLAARVERGFLLPLLFVIASTLAVCVRVALPEGGLSEFWVAGSLLVLASIMLVAGAPRGSLIAVLFLLAGAIHGYALAAGIVGAERTPLAAYLVGLALMLMVIASAAWAATVALFRARPELPVHRLAGVGIGIAGLYFVATAALG